MSMTSFATQWLLALPKIPLWAPFGDSHGIKNETNSHCSRKQEKGSRPAAKSKTS